MSTINTSFANIPVDWSLWQTFAKKYQQNHLRRRLEAIKLLWQGHSRYQLCSDFDFKYNVLTRWLQRYIKEDIDPKRLPKGVKKETLSKTYIALFNLISDKKYTREGFLSCQQEQELKQIILDKQPCEVGIDAYIWTAKTITLYIKQKYDISYQTKSIYDILKRLNLSHQRAHADYSNADPKEQKEFIDKLKKNRTH